LCYPLLRLCEHEKKQKHKRGEEQEDACPADRPIALYPDELKLSQKWRKRDQCNGFSPKNLSEEEALFAGRSELRDRERIDAFS